MIGIYKITNLINNKVYIGQSVDIAKRWSAHKHPQNNEKTALQAAFHKYGIENFQFEIIEECKEDELNDKEMYWIEFYNSYNDGGYNMTRGGEKNHKMDYENIIKVFLQNKSINKTSEELQIHYGTVKRALDYYSIPYDKNHSKPKAIVMIDPYTLKEIQHFTSIVEAARFLNISDSAIRKCLKGNSNIAGGYYWKIENEEKAFTPYIQPKKRGIKVIQLDLNDNFIKQYDTISEANRAMKTRTSNRKIKEVCDKKIEEAFGYHWHYGE